VNGNSGPRAVDETMLHAYVDNELAPDDRQRVVAWLAEHPDDAASVAAWQHQADELHALFDPVLEEPIPERLNTLLTAPARHWLPAWRAAAALALFAAGLGSGWLLRTEHMESEAASPLMNAAIGAHRVFTPEVRHPVEVVAAEEAHLVSWLSKKLGHRLRAPKLGDAGFRLVGGRLLADRGRPAAQFMYEDASGLRLTLYVRQMVSDEETAFRYAEHEGISAFYWVDDKLGYALAGALPRERLLPITRIVYDQLNPAPR